jgi:hypothetical protein
MPSGRYIKVVKQVREAAELARSGALSFDDGAAAIYFLWGQPSHAYIKEGDEVLEGDAALKRIAIGLGKPGKMQWKSKEVLQRETLRASADDLIRILEELSEADTESPNIEPITADAWDGTERRRPESFSYTLAEFPLLPTGAPLWSDVPTSVVHLDTMLANLPSVLVTFDADGVKAAGVVFRGELYDALWVDADGSVIGREAWERILGRRDAIVSAFELDDHLAEALPILWRSRIIFRDLDKRWMEPKQFLNSAGRSREDRGIIVATQTKVGIALYLNGNIAGAWTSVNRSPNPLNGEILDLLTEAGDGAVSIIERVGDDIAEPYPVERSVEAPAEEPDAAAAERPAWLLDDAPAPEPEPEPVAAAPEPEPEPEPAAAAPEPEPEPVAAAPEPEPKPEPVAAAPEPEPQAEPEPEAVATEPEPEPEREPEPEPAAVAPEPEPEPEPLAAAPDLEPPAPATEPFRPASQPAAPALPPVLAPAAAAPPPGSAGPLFSIGESPAAAPATAPAPAPVAAGGVDYAAIINDLLAMGEQRLGPDFAAVSHLLETADRSAPGLRRAISELRQTALPGHDQREVNDIGREMLRYVADRVTAA